MQLITGGFGVLGSAIGSVIPFALKPTHQNLDIGNPKQVDHYFASEEIDTVIHCAAMTSIRACEIRREEAFAINVQGTRNLQDSLRKSGSAGYFVYISTACVFPGYPPDAFFNENDIPHPKNFYALSKLLGEFVISEGYAGDFLIIRTNFAEHGKWKYPAAFVDRFGTYLYPEQVANALQQLIEMRITGIVHIAGNRKLSMYEFARLSDPTVQETNLSAYEGPPVTVNMCLTSNRMKLVPFECFPSI